MQRFLLLVISCVFLSQSAAASCIEPYPPSTVSVFVQHCGKDAFCSCIIDSLQKTVPLADFIEEGSKTGGLEADPRVNRANQYCRLKYPRTIAPTASAPKTRP